MSLQCLYAMFVTLQSVQLYLGIQIICKSTMYILFTNFLQALVEQARGMLETIDGVTTVHGRFYELCSNYHKVSVEGCCS